MGAGAYPLDMVTRVPLREKPAAGKQPGPVGAMRESSTTITGAECDVTTATGSSNQRMGPNHAFQVKSQPGECKGAHQVSGQ